MSPKFTPTLVICTAGAVVALLALALPGKGDPEPGPASGEVTASPAVEIVDFAFSGAANVAPGVTIEVTNADGAAHTLTATDETFDTGVLDPSAAGAVTAPSTPGTYEYFCSIHPSMTGSFRVLE